MTVLTIVAPTTIVGSGVLVYFATAPEIAPVSFQEDSWVTSVQSSVRLSEQRWGQTMTVCRSGNRWFLESERGELRESPFDEIVEWMDTLSDSNQLGLTGPDARCHMILFKATGLPQAAW